MRNTEEVLNRTALKIMEQMGLGVEFRSCSCGQIPCLRLKPLVTALAQSNRAIEIVESFMTIHEEIVSNEDLVLNAKLREILAALEKEVVK